MYNVDYLRLEQVDSKELMAVLNEDSVRKHLVDHPYFDVSNIQVWIEDKIHTDAMPGCKVRAVSVGETLAGWCGIQPDDNGFEIAIVISQKFWGYGIPIFKTLKCWASELGHKEVLFHLLDTRREYKTLAKMATKVRHTQLLGRRFTTYYFSISTT